MGLNFLQIPISISPPFPIFAPMARIQLDIPERLPFQHRVPVRITDLNYAGHLSNHQILSICHDARMKFFQSHGYEELAAEGIGFIMSDTAIVFKSEGFFGQTILVHMGAGDYSRVSFDLFYRLEIEGEDRLLAEVKTGMVGYDYESRKVRSIPAALKAKLGDVSLINEVS